MNVHTPSPPKILIISIRGSKKYLICHSFSLRRKLTQKSKKFNPYQIILHMQQLIHTPTENPSTNIHVNKQNIYDIYIQSQELHKGTLIESTLKGNMNSQHKTNSSWLVTTIKAILKTPIQKFKNTTFSFRRTHEIVVSNSKILAEFKGDLGIEIEAQREIPVNYGSELRDIAALSKLFFYHKDRTKIIKIVQQGSSYHLDPIKKETRKSYLDAIILRGNHKSSQ